MQILSSYFFNDSEFASERDTDERHFKINAYLHYFG